MNTTNARDADNTGGGRTGRLTPAWFGYLFATLAVIVLVGILRLIEPFIPLGRYPMAYILLVLLCTYLLGEGPGLLALVLEWLAFARLFLPPERFWPLANTPEGWAAQISFLLGTFVVLLMAAFVRRSRERIQRLVIELVEEIEDRKRAEEALRESQHDLSRAQAIARIGSWRLDVRRNELLWSDETYRIFGIPKGTPLTYEAFLAHVHPDDREYVDSKWQAALKGEPYDIEHRICVGDAVKWIRETAELEFDEEGKLAGGFGTARDITDSKLALEALERERRRIAAMESLAEATLKAGSFEEVLTTIVVKVREGMNSHSCTLLLLDEEKNELEAVAACNIPEVIGFRIPVGEGFAGKILQEQRTMYVRDAEHDPLVTDPHIKRAGIRSLLGTPLIGRRGAVGVVYVNMKEIREFSEEDRLLLEDLASRTALIIENARLVKEISHNYALLQRALLPARLPEFPGYAIASAYLPVPQAEVGGDFYDFFLTENGKIAILIGDVSGKGIPAASLAAAARSTVRAFAYDISSPDQALSHANAVLKVAKDDPSLFVTVFLVTLDSAGRTCYASAGHPPPALYRAQTGEVRFLTEAGLLLGVVDQYNYEESECYLDYGDKFILYTDGLLEARHDSDMFGFEGIQRVLKQYGQRSPDEIVQALIHESTEWAGGRRSDDMAVIVIERE